MENGHAVGEIKQILFQEDISCLIVSTEITNRPEMPRIWPRL